MNGSTGGNLGGQTRAESNPRPESLLEEMEDFRPRDQAPLQQPLVSVSMITYRHEKYVKQAVLGVLMQQTYFPVELVISNDHSPDNTDAIIRGILQQHPTAGCIRYICHKQNIGIMANALHNLRQCRGTYIAFCEGDDCWTDPRKLQKQVEQLQSHPQSDLCFHPAQTFYGDQSTSQLFGFHTFRQKLIPANEVIAGGGDFCPTASVLIRREIFEKLEHFLQSAPVGDYFLQVMGSIRGGAIYLPKPMCVYRKGTTFSWTTEMQAIGKRAGFFRLILKALKRFEALLGPANHKSLRIEIERQYLHLSFTYLRDGMIQEYQQLYEEYARQNSVSARIKILYAVGLRSLSEPFTREFDRWTFAHPNAFSRAIRRITKAVYQIRSCGPSLIRFDHNSL